MAFLLIDKMEMGLEIAIGRDSASESCCRSEGVPEVCMGYCKEMKSNPRFDGICSEYFEDIKNCLNLTVDEGE